MAACIQEINQFMQSASTPRPSVPAKKNFRAISPDVLRPDDGPWQSARSVPALYAQIQVEKLFG
jgi:hypothetical protein